MRTEDIERLRSIIGDAERVSVKDADLDAHSADESPHEPHKPEAVVWVESAQEVSAVLDLANERGIPVTPWSGGSSLEGNPIPVRGGIALAMYNMNSILEIRPEDLQVRVQPGVVYDDLNERLARYGLFFPPAPASSDVATIGGMVANNSSGMHAVKYGTTRDYVLKLEVVLPTGEIVTLGCNAFKSASGYDLVRLFVGSEGTLGIVTEITLRLRLVPERMAAIAIFLSMKEAAQAIFEIIRYGPFPAALEVMDANLVALVNRWKNLTLAEAPTLVMELHGTPAGIREEAEMIRETCLDSGCTDFRSGISPRERDRLWEGRREAHNAIKYLNVEHIAIVGDIAVPVSRYAEAVERVYEIAARHNIRVYTFGHAGDGNLHAEVLFRKDDPEERQRAELVNDEIVRYAISVGGTATGEHGIGIGKRQFMRQEHGESLEVMRRIKRLLDPNGIMNPGKIFEDD